MPIYEYRCLDCDHEFRAYAEIFGSAPGDVSDLRRHRAKTDFSLHVSSERRWLVRYRLCPQIRK